MKTRKKEDHFQFPNGFRLKPFSPKINGLRTVAGGILLPGVLFGGGAATRGEESARDFRKYPIFSRLRRQNNTAFHANPASYAGYKINKHQFSPNNITRKAYQK